jgi:hypothetical protein
VAAGAQVKDDKAEEEGSVPAPEGITATANFVFFCAMYRLHHYGTIAAIGV